MKRFSVPCAGLLVLAAMVSGCGKSGTSTDPFGGSGSSGDQAQVTEQLAQNPSYVDDDVSQTPDITAAQAPAAESVAQPFGTLTAIQPIQFWRTIRDVRRTFEFAFSDTDSTGHPTVAVVTVRKGLSGSFNILTAPPQDSVFANDIVRKPLHDQWVRRILLERVRVPELGRPRWRIAALSGVEVTSRDGQTRIESLRVQASGVDTTFTDPLAFQRLRHVLHFDAGDSVTLTVTTPRNDDVVVLQHRDRRFRLHSNGDNTYTGVFHVRLLAGLHHLGVNALSNGTLFDDQAPYDSQSWILPYVVRPTELASFEP